MNGIPAPQGPSVFEAAALLTGGDRLWLDRAPVLIRVCDEAKAGVWFNAAWLTFRGRTLGEECGEGWTEAIHPDDRARVLEVFDAAFSRREPFRMEFRLRRGDGVYRWTEDAAAPWHDPDGAFRGFVGVCVDIQDRRQTESDLRALQERLGLAQDAGGVGVWEYDVERSTLVWTPEQKRLFGYDPQAEPPDFAAFEASVHPDDRIAMRTAAAGAWVSGSYEVEFRRHRPDDRGGELRTYIARGRVLRDEEGRPVKVLGVNVDVTARRAGEDRRTVLADLGELLQSNLTDRALFHAVAVLLGSRLRASACGFYELDFNAGLMHLYPVWSAPGFPTLEGPLPLGDYDLVLEDLLAGRVVAVADIAADLRVNDRYREVLRASATLAFVTVPLRREGRMATCLTVLSDAPRDWSDDDVELIRSVAERTWLAAENSRLAAERDRTVAELTAAREALAQQVVERTRERNRVFDLSRELIAVVGRNGWARAVNPAWTDLLGFTEADILASHLGVLVHPDDRSASAATMESLWEGAAVARFDNRVRTSDGGWRWIAWTGVADQDAVYMVGRDVTVEREAADALRAANARLEAEIAERTAVQEQLLQAQKMEAVGQLTGGVAHDFNNLLQVITGALSLIEDAEPKRRARLFEAMRQAAGRGESLTRQLLAFARRSALKPEPLDLAERVEAMRELLDRSLRGDVRVETRFAPDLSPVEVDVGEFELALLNIAVNARDAMPNGGVITIAGEEVERLDDALSGRFVRLSVSDTGVGMAPEVLARVFEPFFTTKDVGKGSGLGLSQVYGFAQQSGGGVRVESAPGVGTTVSLYLPCTSSAPPAARKSMPVAPAGPGSGRVLLVEDDDAVAELACEMIERLGYECRRAASALAALNLLRAEPPDLVLSDIVMPGGVSGVDLARRLRNMRPDLPVLLATGFSAAAAEARQEGLTVLAKPYTLEALRAALAAALTRNREGTAA